MKKIILLLLILIIASSCANYEHLYSKQFRPVDIMSMPDIYKDKYAYLFLAHEKRRYMFGKEPDVYTYIAMDNCRKAGIYYTNTFTLVKLLPGRHKIRIIRPPHPSYSTSREHSAHFYLDVKGGEVFVYDDTRGWSTAIEMVKKDLNHLKDLNVSVDCYDCFEDPTPEKSFDVSCMR